MNKDQKILAEKYNQILFEGDTEPYVLFLFYDHKGHTSKDIYYKIVPKNDLRPSERKKYDEIGWTHNNPNGTKTRRKDGYESSICFIEGPKRVLERSFKTQREYGEEMGEIYKPMLNLDKETEQQWGGIVDEL
jgi:hypothetical protein